MGVTMSATTAPKNRIFSGIQPTGNLHLGNYLGAIRNWVALQDDFESIYCVVDLHAITVPQDPVQLRQSTREVTASLIAAGISPERSILFNQSRVPQHAQLAWIFNCVARLGWLNRMTQFKEKAGKNRENATVGLYSYPTLMAADILAYRATHVPVGEDQKQHLELTRDIAQAFNSAYGVDFFPLPEPQIFGSATRVMSLRNGSAKMSKSDESEYSRINLTDDADAIAQKIRKAKPILSRFRQARRVWRGVPRRRTWSGFTPRLPMSLSRPSFRSLADAALVISNRHLPSWLLQNYHQWAKKCASYSNPRKI
jgi:tryptophanyl-tRNA synthetase